MPRVAESRQSPSEASNVMSDFWVINTSYLRLKTLQLGYTLPKSVLNAIGLSNVRVYYSAENLFTIDSMPLNVDPETVSSRLSSYPLVMTNSFGVNGRFYETIINIYVGGWYGCVIYFVFRFSGYGA